MRKRTRSILKHLALLLACSMVILNLGSLMGRSIVRADDIRLIDVASITLVDIYTHDSGNNPVSLLGDNPPAAAYNADNIYAHLKWQFSDSPRVDITVNTPYKYDLPADISFTDTYGDLMDGNNDVGDYNINGNTITITYTSTEFCASSGRQSELTFSGVVQGDVTSSNLADHITVNFPGVTDSVTIRMVIPPSNFLRVNKDTRSEIPGTEHGYRYTAYVESHGPNTNVIVTDNASGGLYVDPSTIEFYTDAACTNVYQGGKTLIWADQTGFQYKIDSMSDGETIYIRYDVSIDSRLYDPAGERAFLGDSYGREGYHGNVNNHFIADSDESEPADDWNDIGTYKVQINKYHGQDDSDRGYVGWDIRVYKFEYDFDNLYIIDTLPEHTTYVPESLYVNVWGNENPDYVTVDPLPNNQIKINLNDPDVVYYLRNVTNANVIIRYSVKVEQQVSNPAIYVNNAKLYDNGQLVDEATADASVNMPDVISKVGRYDDATAPNAFFTVTINPIAVDVDTAAGHDTLTLTDQFPDAYDLQISTLSITRNDNSPLTTETYAYDETTKILTLNLLDQTAYTVTYRARVNLRVGAQMTSANSTNTMSITGISPSIADGYGFNCLVVTSAGSASSYNPDIATLNIIKHETGDTTVILSGAQFSLAPATIGSGNTVTLGTPVTHTTGASGIASFDVERERVYMLTEVTAPDGYTRDENNYFYAFANDVSSLPATVTYGGQTYTVTIISSDRASRDVYFANDSAAVTIVDPTTPTEPATTTSPTTTEPAQTTPTAAAAAAVVTPTETSSEPSSTTTVQDAVTTTEPSVTEIDPNAVNGAGRGLAGDQPTDASTTAAAVTSVASTGEINSSARILGVVYIFVSFQLLALLRYERKHGMLPTGNNEQG